jgi:hypothetical protein
LPGPAAAWLGAGAGAVVAVGAGPEGARVVVVTPVGPGPGAVVDVAPPPADRVVTAVLDGAGSTATPGGAAVVVVVSTAAVNVVVLFGAPATANSPPLRNDGGPLWVKWYPATAIVTMTTDPTTAVTLSRKEAVRTLTFPQPTDNTRQN